MYHFLSGYTAKVAGTEKGVTEPKATFSTCFGAPFLPLAPEPLREDARREDRASISARVWLVNTGWTGGPYGVGKRMKIAHTRAMIRAALSGALDGVELRAATPVFNLDVPTSCPGVPAEVLKPRSTWAERRGLRRAGRASWRGCSSRTSRRSKRASTPRCVAAGPSA